MPPFLTLPPSKRSVGHLGRLSPPFEQKCHGCWKYLMVAALSFHFQQQTGVNASPASVSGLQRKLHCAYAAHNTLRILELVRKKVRNHKIQLCFDR